MPGSVEEVARRAGVSVATVSRALRGTPHVAEATRLRVLQAAGEVGYVASPSASSLATGVTRCVAVVVPEVGQWFFGRVVAAVEHVLRSRGYALLLYSTPTQTSRDELFASMPMRGRVDGVIVVSLPPTAEEEACLHALQVPLVLLGVTRPGVASVAIDDFAGAHQAVTHLLALGHRRIALLGRHVDDLANADVAPNRRSGYLTALREAGIRRDERLEVDGPLSVPGGEEAMSQLLAVSPAPTAVFAMSDEMVFGALRVLWQAGLRVPDDMSVIGFDDHEMSRILGITTIAQDVAAQGEAAAHLMLAQLRRAEATGPPQPPRVHLLIRGSTAPPGRPAQPAPGTALPPR